MSQSLLISQVQKLLDKKFEALGALDDYGLKAVMFYLQDVMKIKNYELKINYEGKEIVVFVKDSNDMPVFVKTKKQKELDEMVAYFGITDYAVRFASKEEVELKKSESAGV